MIIFPLLAVSWELNRLDADVRANTEQRREIYKKVEALFYAQPLELFPKRWRCLLAGVPCSGRRMLFLKVHSVLCSVLAACFFFLPSSSITFIFQMRPAACIFDKYLSSTVNEHRLKNDLWVKPEQIPTQKGISFSYFLSKLYKQKLLECMLWMLYLYICGWMSTAF